MKRRMLIGTAAIVLAMFVPAIAGAQEPSKSPTETYDLSFTLPTVGVSGCTVCHADPNLVRIEDAGGVTRSIFTDPAQFAETAHAEVLCTGCHVDFAYEVPHKNLEGDEWRQTAASACQSCHDQAFSAITRGGHSPTTQPGVSASEARAARVAEGKPADVPLCGDCHGSHDIQYLDVERWEETSGTAKIAEKAREGRRALHLQGLEMCGSCHERETEEYDDYYHGAAYRQGAMDAPSCWDCHGHHEMRPASDPESPVHPDNLTKTCGKCHDDVNEAYVEYSQLIHRKGEITEEVPIYNFWSSIRSAIQSVFGTIGSWFGSE